jgi:hypothetical protein
LGADSQLSPDVGTSCYIAEYWQLEKTQKIWKEEKMAKCYNFVRTEVLKAMF